MAAKDHKGHDRTEGTMAGDHNAETELERTPGLVRSTDDKRNTELCEEQQAKSQSAWTWAGHCPRGHLYVGVRD